MSEQPFEFLQLDPRRSCKKPRIRGLTMMIDQGLPVRYTEDIAQTAGNYIDFAKIKTGTARLYTEASLREKLECYKASQIKPFIGGQFHEYVLATAGSRALAQFYAEALRLGFSAIEISDNVVPLSPVERREYINRARDAGLEVFGEVGAKNRRSTPEELLEQAVLCLDAGASIVLVEAAELVVDGVIDKVFLDKIMRGLRPDQVMIELPGPWIPGVRHCDIEEMKKLLVAEFGPDVNVANVSPETIIDFEASRLGLGVAGPASYPPH